MPSHKTCKTDIFFHKKFFEHVIFPPSENAFSVLFALVNKQINK